MTPPPTPSAGKRNNLLTGFVFGLFILYAVELCAGLILESVYRASAQSAYSDALAIQNGPLHFVRAFHYWSSSILIAGSFVALAWMLFVRWFNGGHSRIWLATALLFLVSLLSQITGNLLPFDRHGVQTAVIESGVARQMPMAGSTSAAMILGGDQFNAETVVRWHFAHICLLVLGISALGLGWSAIRGEEKSKSTVGTPLVLGLLASLVAAPLGLPAGPSDFGSYEAQVSWYTWPLHGSLHLFAKISPNLGWIGSGVLPPLFAGFILFAPWLSRRFPARAIQAVFVGFCAYFLVAGALFGGQFASLVGNRDPIVVQQTPTVKPNPVNQVLYAKGRDLFNTNSCAGCHGKDGRKGTEGPSLLGVSKRRGSDPKWYQDFIKDPTRLKPNTTMPGFPELKPEETRAIAEFLIHQQP
jgi:quinol-cytochrome oxidoreductase complex cytochrome b subunit